MQHVPAEVRTDIQMLIAALSTSDNITENGAYDEDHDETYIDLTVGYSPDTQTWGYQTGDNSYTGGAYCHPIWATTTLYIGNDIESTVKELIYEIEDQF